MKNVFNEEKSNTTPSDGLPPVILVYGRTVTVYPDYFDCLVFAQKLLYRLNV